MKIIVGSTRIQGSRAEIENVNLTTFNDVLNCIKNNIPVFYSDDFTQYHVMGSYNTENGVNTFALKTGKTLSAEVSDIYNISDRIPSVDILKIAISPIKMDGGELNLTEEEKKMILSKIPLLDEHEINQPDNDSIPVSSNDHAYEYKECIKENTFNALDFLTE